METLCNATGLSADTALQFDSIQTRSRAIDVETNTSPRQLFEQGDFIETVLVTSKLIPASIGEDISYVLDLWFLRIQSLLILQLGHQAAEEIGRNLRVLEDEEFMAAHIQADIHQLALWALKLLLVPVKTRGINQSAIQNYYTLAFEARSHAAVTTDTATRAQWLHNIELVGLYTISTLIVLRDYMTAIHLLRVHYESTQQALMARLLAILHVIIGDTLGSQAWSAKVQDPQLRQELNVLGKFVDDGVVEANDSAELSGLPDIYQGFISEGIAKLEDTIRAQKGSKAAVESTNIVNLFLLYDLCYAEQSRKYKALIAQEIFEAGDYKLENIALINEFAACVNANN